LKLKINDLTNILDKVKVQAKQFGDKVSKKNVLVNKRIEKNSGFFAGSASDAFNNFVDFRVNGDDLTQNEDNQTYWERIKSGLADIGEEFKKNTPGLSNAKTNYGAGGYTFADAQNEILYAETRDANKELDIRYSTEYELLYKNTTGGNTEEAVQSLNKLRDILEGTFKPIQLLAKCTAQIVGNQCSG